MGACIAATEMRGPAAGSNLPLDDSMRLNVLDEQPQPVPGKLKDWH